jgi:hypothetical protein
LFHFLDSVSTYTISCMDRLLAKMSENRKGVFPQSHNENPYNFILKLSDILYLTFSLCEPISRVVIEISIFASIIWAKYIDLNNDLSPLG